MNITPLEIMKKRIYLIIASLFSCYILLGVTAHADSQPGTTDPNFFTQDPDQELGYLNSEQIYSNKRSPFSADNPVNQGQRSARNYPLLPNSANFDDEFKPKDFSKWQVIQLGPETGATCGDGSPYKFFINRRPKTVNMVLYFEPGGACLDYDSCTGADGIRGARNPNGLPDNYLSSIATNSITPLISSGLTWLAPGDRVEPVEWSTVFLPYCTGDIFSGDRVVEYVNPRDPKEKLLWHHNGVRNVRAVLAWLKDNMPKPPQMLATGCSAGGVGSTTNYAHLRKDLDPIQSFLINDSGPTFNAPIGSSLADFPSVPLHIAITSAWGLNNGFTDYLTRLIPNFDARNMGSIYSSLATEFPNDRLGYTHFWADRIFSSYSYELSHPEMALGNTPQDRWPLLRARWEKDTNNLLSELNSINNFGYYIPRERGFSESHCTTVVTFHNTEIDELDLSIQEFIANILDGSGPVLQASETDRRDPGYFSFVLWIAGLALGDGPSVVQPLDDHVVVEFINSRSGKNFGSIIPGSSELNAEVTSNNQWIINPNEDTKFLRFVNLNTGKTINNERSRSRIVADNVISNRYWSAQWYPQFTTLDADELVLGARHGNYIYLSMDGNALKTIHSSNIFSDSTSNERSKWTYSAKFLSELDDADKVRTRDVATLLNPQSGSVLHDLGNSGNAYYAPSSENPINATWLVKSIAEKDDYIMLQNANTGKSLNIEAANGKLQVGNLPSSYWSQNWIVELHSGGQASFRNRWQSRKHRFHVDQEKSSGIAKESNLGENDARARWSYRPQFEATNDFDWIPKQDH